MQNLKTLEEGCNGDVTFLGNRAFSEGLWQGSLTFEPAQGIRRNEKGS